LRANKLDVIDLPFFGAGKVYVNTRTACRFQGKKKEKKTWWVS